MTDKITDPVKLWQRADSGTAKAVAGNALVAEIERLRARLAKISNAPVPADNTIALTLKAWAMPREGETPYERPTGRELCLLNDAISLVYLLETGMGISLTDSAKARLHDLRLACEKYVGSDLRQVPVRIVSR